MDAEAMHVIITLVLSDYWLYYVKCKLCLCIFFSNDNINSNKNNYA